ncbi:ABC transporter substrate-binding protein [Leadbettera azotonutricia]|uniref:Extracellular solute-binding protein, family 5 n=1 Tax=Leadbettera azotonutricia (strain ATCC BAA-888 / DSM 13862 / ZAS-9) TaxID=545695 RepID=F5YA50_LEAAZ|nr:ABC transporter substrate-binding protein [Leadbettera azotonutricia]AEF81692.1 extracellular solute-binding protein, family 5 [Leadbettera azotonutricia ZAS-9]
MKYFKLQGLAAVLALAVFAGQNLYARAQNDQSGAIPASVIINIGSLYEPTNLSSTEGGGQGVTEAFNGNVYEGLFKLTDEGKVENLLAVNYTKSADGLTYTITLRDGVRFHSGKALSSADVKASFERAVAPGSLSARISSFRIVKSVATPDAKTVVFTLNTPSISFLYNLAYLWILNIDGRDFKTSEDGTGPYVLDRWTRGSSLSIKKWDGYWGTPAKNAGVVFNYFTDASALSNALLSGQIDIITAVQSPDGIAQFENNRKYVINNGASTTKELLAFNDRNPPFNNANVRKAIYSAVNRQKLLSSIWGNYGSLIGSMVPPTDPWYDASLVNANPYDINLAKQLLASGGYPNGFAFTLDTPTYDPHPTVAEFLKSELAAVGITVNINSISADEWYTKVYKERNFAATLQEHVNDRDVVWYGNPDFYWGYSNPEVVRLVSESEQVNTPEEQTQKLLEVNRTIAREAASVWLYLYPQIVISASNVSGYPINGLNSQFYAYNIVKTN